MTEVHPSTTAAETIQASVDAMPDEAVRAAFVASMRRNRNSILQIAHEQLMTTRSLLSMISSEPAVFEVKQEIEAVIGKIDGLR